MKLSSKIIIIIKYFINILFFIKYIYIYFGERIYILSMHVDFMQVSKYSIQFRLIFEYPFFFLFFYTYSIRIRRLSFYACNIIDIFLNPPQKPFLRRAMLSPNITNHVSLSCALSMRKYRHICRISIRHICCYVSIYWTYYMTDRLTIFQLNHLLQYYSICFIHFEKSYRII